MKTIPNPSKRITPTSFLAGAKLMRQLKADATNQGVSQSDIIRSILTRYYDGKARRKAVKHDE